MYEYITTHGQTNMKELYKAIKCALGAHDYTPDYPIMATRIGDRSTCTNCGHDVPRKRSHSNV